jgi:hypothetical protein
MGQPTATPEIRKRKIGPKTILLRLAFSKDQIMKDGKPLSDGDIWSTIINALSPTK